MFKQEIEKGAEFLDERAPGWEKKIKPDTLNLGSGCDCILGQVFGDYTKGWKKLKLDTVEKRADLGFTLTDAGPFSLLTREWLAYLANRAINPFKRAYKRWGG